MTVEISPPPAVAALMAKLWAHGHAAYVVGGSVRDTILGRAADDWDLTTDARPERLLEVFPGAIYENQFGTVAVREGGVQYEITTFRTDHEYADFRRPHHVEFGDSIELDLARRDFTVNAIAWGARAPESTAPSPGALDATPIPDLVDPPTLEAIRANASLAAHVSGERVAAELQKLLFAARPSIGLRLMSESGLLDVLLPELAAQRGIAQNKIEGEDLFDHSLRSVDAAPAGRPVVRMAALLHDIGKPSTVDDGPFRGHEVVGADMARQLLDRLRMPKVVVERVVHLVRNHMFNYESEWGDPGVRRFIQRVGAESVDELFALREADNLGSGLAPDPNDLAELRARVQAELAASVVLDRSRLAVHGDDLMTELALPAGPHLGHILDALLERVIADPKLNDRATLLLLAESMLTEDR